MKAQPGHAGNSGGEGDEGPHYGKQAADEYGKISPAGEEAVSPVQFAATDEDPAAVALDQSTPTKAADFVRDQRAYVAADCARSPNPEQLHGAFEHQVSGEWHDEFGGQRNAGRFNAHQDHNAAVAADRDQGFDEDEQYGKNFFAHEKKLLVGVPGIHDMKWTVILS